MKNTTKAEIGARIRTRREQAGLTREKFGELCSLSPRFIANVELGDSAVSVDTLMAICQVLSCSSDYILFGAASDDNWEDTVTTLRRIPDKYQPEIDQIIHGVYGVICDIEEN